MSRRAPAHRAHYAYFCTIPTRWFDNDIYGHMNNTVHYQFFDTAVNGMLIEAGLLNLTDSATVFLVAETGCTYHAELAFPDLIHVGLRVARLGCSSVRYELALFANALTQAAAEGHFVHVNVTRADRHPAPLPEATRRALGKFEMPAGAG